jgi:hypothetical protein
MIVFQRGNITGEIEGTYSGATGERIDTVLWIVETGPRGGRHVIWRGGVGSTQRMVDDLLQLLAGVSEMPKRLSGAAVSRGDS